MAQQQGTARQQVLQPWHDLALDAGLGSARHDAPTRLARCVFFFFQAEDGIRDYKVTGVQTCALPIWANIEEVPIVATVEDLHVSGDLDPFKRDGLKEWLSDAPPQPWKTLVVAKLEIGRASCRERV